MKSGSKGRILCVDDSQDDRDLFEFVLSETGYQVKTASGVSEAIAAAQIGNFNLYLIDLSLMNGTGFEVIEKIRSLDFSTPIIVCSGNVCETVQDEAMRAGVQAVLRKPVDLEDLLRTVTELINTDTSTSE